MDRYRYGSEDDSDGDSTDADRLEAQDEALVSFSAPMFISGDTNDTFRAKNASLTDWQRRIVIERLTKATEIRCHLLEVVHGKLTPRTDSPSATLMVFKFRFDSVKHARRLVRARIDIEFFAKENGGEAPTVLAVAPDERWEVVPTVDHEDWTAGGNLNAGASGLPILTLGGEVSLQKTWAKNFSDATTVTGGSHFGEGIDSGKRTACGWTMLENSKRQTGLPDSLTVAVLVQRETDKQFNGIVNLEARGNFKTMLDWMFNKVPVDDPVLFNPAMAQLDQQDDVEVNATAEAGKAAAKGPQKVTAKQYGRNELGRWETEIHKLADVTFRTVYKNGEKSAG